MRAPDSLPDQQLLVQMAEGSESAFTEIYWRYWDKLFVTAYNRLADEHEAEEAVQNVFLSLWNRRASLELSFSLGTYLATSVKYQILTRLSRISRESEHISYLRKNTEEGADSTTDWLSERELKQKLEKQVRSLPQKCRIVFQLSREEGLSNSQIAEKLKIAEKTVEGHITKAINILRGTL